MAFRLAEGSSGARRVHRVDARRNRIGDEAYVGRGAVLAETPDANAVGASRQAPHPFDAWKDLPRGRRFL
jgi:hypothetical protein